MRQFNRLIAVFIAVFLMMPLFTVSAAEDDPVSIAINFYDNTLTVKGGTNNFSVFFMIGNTDPLYMYAPDATLNPSANKEASEKWYPLYSDTLDINAFIPKSTSKKDKIIAIRLASDSPDEKGHYSSRTAVVIPPRPAYNKTDLKNKIKYNPLTEKIELANDLKNSGVDYKIGLSGWILNYTNDITVSSKYNYLGNVVYIRVSSTSESFASDEYKLTIPKPPAAPKVKLSAQNDKITGLNLKQLWATNENGTDATPITDKTSVLLSAFEIKFGEISNFQTETNSKNQECIAIYFFVSATDKKPRSPATKVLIPLEFIGK